MPKYIDYLLPAFYSTKPGAINLLPPGPNDERKGVWRRVRFAAKDLAAPYLSKPEFHGGRYPLKNIRLNAANWIRSAWLLAW
jgi:hypothetical protein